MQRSLGVVLFWAVWFLSVVLSNFCKCCFVGLWGLLYLFFPVCLRVSQCRRTLTIKNKKANKTLKTTPTTEKETNNQTTKPHKKKHNKNQQTSQNNKQLYSWKKQKTQKQNKCFGTKTARTRLSSSHHPQSKAPRNFAPARSEALPPGTRSARGEVKAFGVYQGL